MSNFGNPQMVPDASYFPQLVPPRTPFGPRRQRPGGTAVGSYATQQAYEESLGRPTRAVAPGTKVVTVSDAGVYRIQPLDDKVAIAFGVSAELLVRESNAVTVFIGHPDDVAFDSMDMTVTGQTGPPASSTDDMWIATSQLVQLHPSGEQVLISGAFKEFKEGIRRLVTTLPAFSDETVTELNGGFIEKPWGMFLNIGLTRVLGNAALPAELADARIQVTVNLVSQAT